MREAAELGAVVEQAGVEEVRAHAPGLGLEIPEAQYAGLDREAHELLGQVVGGGLYEVLREAHWRSPEVFRLVTLNLNGIRSARLM